MTWLNQDYRNLRAKPALFFEKKISTDFDDQNIGYLLVFYAVP